MPIKIFALIPARSGSKGIIDKNIKDYKGIPLIAHSIKLAKECKWISAVYVSTDSIEYQNIACKYGALVCGLRPKNISDDLSPDIDCFKHFLLWLQNENIEIPDIIIHLRPTYPNRSLELLNDCIIKFLTDYEKYDSLRTVVKIKNTPYKMYFIKDKYLIPFMDDGRFKEPFNQARQYFPNTYLHNGCIDIVKTKVIKESNLLSGRDILPYIMDEDEINDIDDINDFFNSLLK